MSFLPEEPEAQATLDETLAFIDAFARELEGVEDSDSASGANSSLFVELRIPQLAHSNDKNNTSSNSSSARKSSTGSSESDRTADGGQKKLSKCRAANAQAVERYRKRTKNEVVELRNKVRQLTTQLTVLHKRRRDTSGGSKGEQRLALGHSGSLPQIQSGSAVGFEAVLLEYRKLQESEALNHKLKDELAKQRAISSTLESVFQRAILKKDLSFVWDIESRLQKKATPSPAMVLQDSKARAYSELFQYLKEVVYDNTDAVLQQLNRCDTDCVFSNKMIKHDRAVGKTLELTSSMPLFCSLEQLDGLLWENLVNPSDNKRVVEFIAQSGAGYDDGCERPYTATFTGSLGHVQVNGVTAVHRFVEPHRVVLTYTSLLAPVSSSDLRLRESGWLVMSDSHVSGCLSSPTLFQTVYRMHAERQSTVPRSPESVALLEFVMQAQSEKMHTCYEVIHNLLEHQLRWVAHSAIMKQGFHGTLAEMSNSNKRTELQHPPGADNRNYSSIQNEWLQVLLCGIHAAKSTTGPENHACM